MPLMVGVYQIYDVSETIYVNGPVGELRLYQLKTEVVDSLPGAKGLFTYVISRQIRSEEDQNWVNLDTWSASFSEMEAIVQQGNTSFVKLLVPASPNLFWNGNLYNTLGEETYTITSSGNAFTIGEMEFTDVVEVTQREEVDNIVGNDIRKEVYARGVGLVKRTEEVVLYCSDADLCVIGAQEIQQGTVIEQVIVEYGKK